MWLGDFGMKAVQLVQRRIAPEDSNVTASRVLLDVNREGPSDWDGEWQTVQAQEAGEHLLVGARMPVFVLFRHILQWLQSFQKLLPQFVL